jgi:DNA-binding GntR family transcriptional regulator
MYTYVQNWGRPEEDRKKKRVEGMTDHIGQRIASLRSRGDQLYASRSEAAYDLLRTAVMEGLLQPGQRLREIDVSDWLDMSRTPVREAFRRLERDGLITFAPHKGMTVTVLDHGAIMELYRMREVLEGTAASLAAQHATDAEIAALEDMIIQETEFGADSRALAGHNVAFHNAIYAAAHNRYLLRSLYGLRDSMALLGRTTYSVPGRVEAALNEHRTVVGAIARRDPGAADVAMRAHLRSAQHARLRQMQGKIPAAM